MALLSVYGLQCRIGFLQVGQESSGYISEAPFTINKSQANNFCNARIKSSIKN